MEYPLLQSPGKIGALTIKNRIVVPSVNTNYTRAAHMTELSIDTYRRKAAGGAGLIILEATSVDYPQSRSVLNPAIDQDAYMPGFRKIGEVCHEYGAKVMVQLSHVGRQTRRELTGRPPVAPSPIGGNSPLYPEPPRVLEVPEIEALIQKYGDAALRTQRCGLDGVEIIMGHGYLLNNFLSPLSNVREDEYGGLKGGLRLCCQVVQEIKSRCGKDFPVICRINGNDFVQSQGNTAVEAQLIAQQLEKAGADAIHVSGGMRDSELNFNDHTCGTPHGSWLSMAGQIRRGISIPVIAVKRLTPLLAEHALARQEIDFAAFGKQSVADPDFPNKLFSGREDDILPCVSCSQGCYDRLWMRVPITCMFNPAVGRPPEELAERHARKGSGRILVAGGGPAGCMAALELRKFGYQVCLAEQESCLGGQYLLASKTKRKGEIAQVMAYFAHALNLAGVEVRLNTPCTVPFIQNYAPKALVLALGSHFKPLYGINNGPLITTPDRILKGIDLPGQHVAIITCGTDCPWKCRVTHTPLPEDVSNACTNESSACGAGIAASDLALELARNGHTVSILTQRNTYAPGMGFTNRNYLMRLLFAAGVSVSGGVTVHSVTPDGLLCEKEGLLFHVAADTVVSSGKLQRNSLVGIETVACPVYRVGDCHRIGNGFDAFRDTYDLAAKIARELG